jgi:hypothetical protein
MDPIQMNHLPTSLGSCRAGSKDSADMALHQIWAIQKARGAKRHGCGNSGCADHSQNINGPKASPCGKIDQRHVSRDGGSAASLRSPSSPPPPGAPRATLCWRLCRNCRVK